MPDPSLPPRICLFPKKDLFPRCSKERRFPPVPGIFVLGHLLDRLFRTISDQLWLDLPRSSTSAGQAPRVCAHVSPPHSCRCCLCCHCCLWLLPHASCGFELLQCPCSPTRSRLHDLCLDLPRHDLDLTGTRALLHTRPRHTPSCGCRWRCCM